MGTYNLTEQQIKDLASGELKVTDIVKKEITPGWYKVYYEGTDNELIGIFYLYEISGVEVWHKYGYNHSMEEWEAEDWSHIAHTFIPATDKEVEEMLTEEIVRRYGRNWKNIRVKSHADCGKWLLGDGEFAEGYFFNSNKFYNKNGVLFSDGNWAEIAEEPLTIEERLKRIEKHLGL